MSTTPNQRDIDIRIASELSESIEDNSDFFVLTGSYSIDALTGADVKHNDIDANIFTKDLPVALGRVVALLQACTDDMRLAKRTDTRLEYLRSHRHGSTQVEMQFVQYDGLKRKAEGFDLTLPHNSDHESIVPIVRAGLRETDGHEHSFYVKSLPFAIGTWALRISGVALNQKREVRDSDIRHFAFLTATPHDRKETLNAIQHHPQMPDNHSAADIIDMSYEVLARRGV